MKTSKRLLSFVLAVVMALTACSAGFAAFAQEVNPKDNSPFSAENASAKGSVTALNQLVNDYLPDILGLIGEDKLAGVGISLQKIKDAKFDDEDIASDAFYELMSELSVPLYGTFGQKELTDVITANSGLSFGDTSFDKEFYSYLDDEDAAINFWTMYDICSNNADENGSDFEKLCYKYFNGYTKDDGTVVKGLRELLAAEKALYGNASGIFTGTFSKILQLCEVINMTSKAGNGIYYNLPADEIQSRIDNYTDKNGDVKFSYQSSEVVITADEINKIAAGISAELSFFTENHKAETLGDIIYYFLIGQYAAYAGIFNECANIGGADYSNQGIDSISYDNWYEVLSAMMPFEQFKASFTAPADYTDDDIMAVYYANLQQVYFSMMAGNGTSIGSSPERSAYFHEIILGYLAKYNISTIEESKAKLESAYITSAQYQGLKAADIRGSAAFKSYIVNDEGNLGFSQYFKSFINSLDNANSYRNAIKNYDPETNPDPFAAAGLTDAIYNSFYKSLAYDTPNHGFVTQTVDTYMFQALIQEELAEYTYDYDNYPMDGKYMINLVNTTINGYVNMIKDLNKVINVAGMDINSIVNSVLAALFQTKDADGNTLELEDIANMLTDVYVKLAKDPVSTISNLLPLLVVAIDEILVPLFLNDNSDSYGNDFVYNMLTKENELLFNVSQDAYQTVKTLFDNNGINTLNFDLNYILPSLLHYMQGDEKLISEYYEGVTTEDGRNVPVITNIRVADEWVANNLYKLKVLETINISADNPELNAGIREAVTEIANVLTISVDSYLDGNAAIGVVAHRNDTKVGTSPSGDPATICKGLNNLGVALPLLIDTVGKVIINKYNIDSDWQFGCRIVYGSDSTTGNTFVTAENATLTDVKEHVFDSKPDASNVSSWLVQLIVSDWLNAFIDFANDLFATDNDITNNIPIISSLLNSLGGFGETSIVSDILNGFFSLTRTNKYNFALAERSIPCSTDDSASYVGFSEESAYFLIANVNPIVRLILDIVNAPADDPTPDNPTEPTPPAEPKEYADITINFDTKMYSQENIDAANELLDTLDSILGAVFKNTYLNGYTVDRTDGILSGVVTFLVNHLGKSTTDDLIGLVKKYLELIVAESTIDGYAPARNTNANGPVDAKKVYSNKNLSILVTQTYVLLEEILNQVLTIKGDNYNCIRGAVKGIISPSAVAIRSDVISEDVMDYLNWTDINESKYATDLGYDNLKAGDKETFYNDLFDSLGAITAIVGTLLCTTGYYNNIAAPIISTICDSCGVKDYVASLDAAATGEDALMAIFKPVSALVNQFLQTPATTLVELLNGILSCLQDSVVTSIINGAINPLFNEIRGAGVIVSNLSPTLGGIVVDFIDGLKGIIDTVVPEKDVVVTLINTVLAAFDIPFELPAIDWTHIISDNAGVVILNIYNIAVDTILSKDILKLLLGEKNATLVEMLSKLDSSDVLNMINEILSITQNPTEVYWTFESYLSKATNTFTYPSGITKSEADDAVDQLDSLVANVFPLLQSFGVLDQSNLTEVVSNLLFTNDMLTKIATGVYGAIENKAAGKFSFTPAQFAAYLTDKSYGNTYTSAANELKKCSSWSQVKNINWGFKDGSAKAEQGFINGLAALCRPVNDVLAVFLADGELDIKLLTGILKDLEIGKNNYNTNDAVKYSITLIDGVLNMYFLNTAEEATEPNRVQINLIDILNSIDLSLYGSNGYESAIIPLLEAFMCDNVKTYSQYIKDYGKAKDNLIINVLNPLFGFVDDVLAAPFDTITKVLPNIAYFIDNNGLERAVSNLIAPLTEVIIKALNDNGLDVNKLVNEIIKMLNGKDLNGLLADLLGSDIINLNLNDLTTLNIKDIVIPLVNSLLSDYGIKLPDFKWSTLASHGIQKTVSSAARDENGNYSSVRIIAHQGETLVAVLRYISDALITNASSIKKLICSIDGVAKNKTIVNILTSVFNQISTAHKDQIVQAVFYLLTQNPQNKFFDYRGFKYKDYEFSYPSTVDVEFLTVIGPMLDGLVGGLVEGGLNSLISGLIYKDSIISDLAVGLYGAIEGVKINDSMNLAQLLAKTDIDFTTDNVAKLLKDKDYGTSYSSAAKVIEKAGSWSKVNKESLSWGVTDRDSFLHALCAVLRPVYGVLDVLLNDGSLGLFNLIYLPGSDGYTSAIVPLMEAFGLYNIKTQYQYRQDMSKEYDAILLDILNPLMDKVEDLLNAPIEVLADMLPNLSLFFANDGLLQLIENLLTPISALLKSIQPIVNVNDLLKTLGLDIEKEISKLGLSVKNFHFDIYDLAGSLKPLIGADNIVGLLNSVLGLIKIGGQPLNLELMPIDWYQLASHGTVITDEASQAATFGGRIYVKADASEVLIAVLRYLINTVNYKDNFNTINNLISGLIGGASDSVSGVVSQVLGMLTGDTDDVISELCNLLQTLA